MDERKAINSNYKKKNSNNESDKKVNSKISSNIFKTSKKLQTKMNMFVNKTNTEKKEKTKQKDNPKNVNYPSSKNNDKKDKINKNLFQNKETTKSKTNNKKNSQKKKNIQKETTNKSKILNKSEGKNKINSISSKKYESPIKDKNNEEEGTSVEKNLMELNSPETFSENSFTDEKEYNEVKNKIMNKKSVELVTTKEISDDIETKTKNENKLSSKKNAPIIQKNITVQRKKVIDPDNENDQNEKNLQRKFTNSKFSSEKSKKITFDKEKQPVFHKNLKSSNEILEKAYVPQSASNRKQNKTFKLVKGRGEMGNTEIKKEEKNFRKLNSNLSLNNIVYAPKKVSLKRVNSHSKMGEEVNFNISNYEEVEINKTNIKSQKKDYNVELKINSLFDRNNDFGQLSEKNKGFARKEENELNSLRLNLFNNPQKVISMNSENNQGENNNSDKYNFFKKMNYNNRTAEKIGRNNKLYFNKVSSGDGLNINNFIQNNNFNSNLSTDLNNAFTNMSPYPPFYNFIPQMNNQPNIINLFNNNYLDINNICRNSSYNRNYNLNDIMFPYKINTHKNPSINIEDLIILQEKLKNIKVALNTNKIATNECFEFLNFYYNFQIYIRLENLFKKVYDSNCVRISLNFMLFSIILCYEYSFDLNCLSKAFKFLETLIKLNYQNLLLICEYILMRISKDSINNIWVKKLKNILNDFIEQEISSKDNIIDSISINSHLIFNNLVTILKNYQTINNQLLINYFGLLKAQSYEQINLFFNKYILRIHNINGSLLSSIFLRNNINFKTLPAPYVRTKNNKEFSLVLDLDETLVHFKDKDNGLGDGILQIRPGLTEFLEEIVKYYELILFTSATQDYADALIDAVEKEKIYFDHRLYREYTVILDNDFVKDLSRIGRPLDKIIIVDNMPQNFRLQKENGIMIKPFWGEDSSDRALFNLCTILINIAKDGGDIRDGLQKYRDEILKKVSIC